MALPEIPRVHDQSDAVHRGRHHAMLLEPMDDQLLASPTPEEETNLLGKPQEVEVAAACPPRHEEQAPEPKNVAKQMEAATETQGIWWCLPLPGFQSPLPEQDVPLI